MNRIWAKPLGKFFLILVLNAMLNIAVGFLRVPVGYGKVATIAVTVPFIVLPILALFFAAGAKWTHRLAFLFLLAGALLQFGLASLAGQFVSPQSTLAMVLGAISQQGLPMWTLGIGALIAVSLKEKNIILPVSIFLALFDIFLVLTPIGITQVIMKAAPKALPTVAYQLPQVAQSGEVPLGVRVAPFAYIGPADFLFMGMFFVCVHHFNMRVAATLKWLLTALAVYLAMAVLIGTAVPLLVPIGLSVLIVNLPEFKLTRDEWIGTAMVAVLGIGLIAFGMTRKPPVKQVVLETPVASPAPSKSPGSPAPAPPR
jgi:hypothetical protein